MEETIVRITELPIGIYGCTLLDEDGNYNIYISSLISYEMQLKAYRHELEHIKRGDWFNSIPVAVIERAVRSAV